MSLRLDRVLTLPGLTTGSKTYSLLVDDGWLYVLRLGPGIAQHTPRADPISLWLAKKMLKRIHARQQKNVAAAEAQLADEGAEAFMAHTKSVRYEKPAITTVEARGGQLRLEAGGDRWTFYTTHLLQKRDRSAELAAFADGIKAWADGQAVV